MTTEQLKLIQQLAELGDVTIVNRGVTNLEWINWANYNADWVDPLNNKPDEKLDC